MHSKRQSTLVCLSVVVLGLAEVSSGAIVLPITGTGTATGSGATGLSGAFDAQPVSVPTVGNTNAASGSGPSFFSVGDTRTGFVDFGPSFATFNITATYEMLQQFGTSSNGSMVYAWSTDTTVGSDLASPDFGFLSSQSANSNQQWIQRYNNPTGTTPLARYLLITRPSTVTEGNRSREWVFAGTNASTTISLTSTQQNGNVATGGAVTVIGQSGNFSSEVDLLTANQNKGSATISVSPGALSSTVYAMLWLTGQDATTLGTLRSTLDALSNIDAYTAAAPGDQFSTLNGGAYAGFNMLVKFTGAAAANPGALNWDFGLQPGILVDRVAIIPEPGSLSILVAVGAMGMLSVRRRRTA